MLKHIDFVASNVAGIDAPIFLAGALVSRYFVFGPTTGSAMNATLLSYNGTCCVGFTIDSAAVPDYDVLMRCMRRDSKRCSSSAGTTDRSNDHSGDATGEDGYSTHGFGDHRSPHISPGTTGPRG